MPPVGSAVWMRAGSRLVRAVLIGFAAGDLVLLRFDEEGFNCDGMHLPAPHKPYRALRTAAFAHVLDRVEACDA